MIALTSNNDTAQVSGFSAADLSALRLQFPILQRTGRGGRPIAYLDSAATSQKPQVVIDAVSNFYARTNAAINRGTHLLGDESTTAYEQARETVARYVGADADGLIWTKNATEGINLLALALSAGVRQGAMHLRAGDEVCVTRLEHHANIVPWQQACARTGAKLTWLEATPDGRLDMSTVERVNERTKIVAVTHASNVTGAVTDIAAIVAAARKVGALVVLDSCQSSAHMPMDVSVWDVDAAVFSSHKMMGPTGIGALYVRPDLLAELSPVMTGGSMVAWVEMDSATFHDGPAGFEAGSQPAAQAVGWATACDFVESIGVQRMMAHEHHIGQLLLDGLLSVPQVSLLGPRTMDNRLAVIAFDIAGIHPHDVGQILDDEDIAVRVGHHCAIPLHTHFGVRSSTRVSATVTTTEEEVDRLVAGVQRVVQFFGGANV